MYPEKTSRPDNLRQPFHTDREAPQAARCDNPKKYSSRLPSAFGQFSAKSLASVRKCTPKRRSGQTTSGCLFPPIARLPQAAQCDDLKKSSSRLLSAFGQSPAKNLVSLRRCSSKKRSCRRAFGFGSILFEKSLQRPAAIPRKSTVPDRLQLWVNPLRKTTQAARCDDPKKCSSRQLPAFGQYFAKNHSSSPLQ